MFAGSEMSITRSFSAPARQWNSFDEYQEYQIGVYSNPISYSFPKEEGEDEEEYEGELEDEGKDKGKDEKEDKKLKNIKFTEPLSTEDIMSIIQSVNYSYFNRFGKVIFNKPYYYNSDTFISYPPPKINIKAFTEGNLTTSVVTNTEERNSCKKEFINNVYESIIEMLSFDDNFKITSESSFYSMDVEYNGYGYNEKFQIKLYVDRDNEYDVFVEMKGIKMSNRCNVFFFYHINKALKKNYIIESFSSYIEGGCPVEDIFTFKETNIGFDFLPLKFKRPIILLF